MPDLKYLNEDRAQELINETKARLTAKVTRYTTMPIPDEAYAGRIVLYVGATTQDYTQGDFYKGTYDAVDGAAWEKTTYNKSEVDALISAAGHFTVVAELPTTDIATNVIYLVPKISNITGYYDGTANDPVYVSTGTELAPAFDKYQYDNDLGIYIFGEEITSTDAETIQGYIDDDTYSETTVSAESRESNNVKTEYVNLDGTSAGWEKIGDTAIDLSDYVKFENLIPITSAELAAMWEDT